jgi:hypothetical protein
MSYKIAAGRKCSAPMHRNSAMNHFSGQVLILSCLLLPGVAKLSHAAPLLPDLFPWADQTRDFMYDGVFDTTTIWNKVLYRFHGVLPNIGAGALELREVTHADNSQDVYQRIYQSEGGITETLIGTFPDADPPYGHLYLVGIAQYNLRSVIGENGLGPVVSSHDKISYALVDSLSYDLTLPNAPLIRKYRSSDEFLGISVGWADLYSRSTQGQWADATGLPSGKYWLEVIADPYQRIQESDETNNTTRVLLDLTIPSPEILPGDYNQDGIVDAADYTVWRNKLGTTVLTPGTGADGDGDGKITAADYPVWKLHYGDQEIAAAGNSHPIPEPSAPILVAVLIAMLASSPCARPSR